MAHKALIDGTAYEVTGGKCLVNGTSYSISKGRTLIGGTGYDINFLKVGYEVLPIDGVDYTFTLNSDGYYESNNQGVASSYAMACINIVTNGLWHVYIDCVQYSEGYDDYAVVSTLDGQLSMTATNNGVNVRKSFYGIEKSTSSIKYEALEKGKHSIYVKFMKGSDTDYDYGDDSFKFQVRFVPYDPNYILYEPSYNVVRLSGADYGFTYNSSTGYYENQNAEVSSSFALSVIIFNTTGNEDVVVRYTIGSETNWDCGLISKADTALDTTNTEDSSSLYMKKVSGVDEGDVEFGKLSEGEHIIYIKYYKDQSVNNNGDTFGVKLLFGEIKEE